MLIADNLMCNDHFRAWPPAGSWRARTPATPRPGGRAVLPHRLPDGGRPATYRHPSGRGHGYALRKLMRFGMEHGIELLEVMKILEAATGQLPDVAHGEEAEALRDEIDELQEKRGSGVRTLGEILPAVLVKLGVELIQSEGSGEIDRT